MNTKSLENLKKGKATQFGVNGDVRAKEAGIKSGEVRRAYSLLADEMRAYIDEHGQRKHLAETLLKNMTKSPKWCELGLQVVGELPPKKITVASSISAEAAAELEKMVKEYNARGMGGG